MYECDNEKFKICIVEYVKQYLCDDVPIYDYKYKKESAYKQDIFTELSCRRWILFSILEDISYNDPFLSAFDILEIYRLKLDAYINKCNKNNKKNDNFYSALIAVDTLNDFLTYVTNTCNNYC